jgi:hypothetical protein
MFSRLFIPNIFAQKRVYITPVPMSHAHSPIPFIYESENRFKRLKKKYIPRRLNYVLQPSLGFASYHAPRPRLDI